MNSIPSEQIMTNKIGTIIKNMIQGNFLVEKKPESMDSMSSLCFDKD